MSLKKRSDKKNMDVGKQFSRDPRPSQSTTLTGSKNAIQQPGPSNSKSYLQNQQKSPQSKYYDVRKIENERSSSKSSFDQVNLDPPVKESSKTSRANEYIERLKEIREIIKNRELQNLLTGLSGAGNTKSPIRNKDENKSLRVVNNENFDPWLEEKNPKSSKMFNNSAMDNSPIYTKSQNKTINEDRTNSSNIKSKAHSRLVSMNEPSGSDFKKRVDLKTLNFGYSPNQKKPDPADNYTPSGKKKDIQSMKISITKDNDLSDSYIKSSEDDEYEHHTFRGNEDKVMDFPPGAKTPSDDPYEEPVKYKKNDFHKEIKDKMDKVLISFDKNSKLSPFSPVANLEKNELLEKPKRLYTDSTNFLTDYSEASEKPYKDSFKHNFKATPEKKPEKILVQSKSKPQQELKKSVLKNRSPREELKSSPRKEFFRGLEVRGQDDDPLDQLLGRSPSPIAKATPTRSSRAQPEPERKNQWIARDREASKSTSSLASKNDDDQPYKKPATPIRGDIEKNAYKNIPTTQKSPINQKKASISTIAKTDTETPLVSTYRDFNSNGSTTKPNLEINIPDTQRTQNQPPVLSPSHSYQSNSGGPHYPYYPNQMPIPQYPGPYMPPPNYNPYYQMPYPPPNYYPYNYMPPYQMPPPTGGYMPYGYAYPPQPYYPHSMMENSYQQSHSSRDVKYPNSFAYPQERNGVQETQEDQLTNNTSGRNRELGGISERLDEESSSSKVHIKNMSDLQKNNNSKNKTPLRDNSSKVTFANDTEKPDTKRSNLTPKGAKNEIQAKVKQLGSEESDRALPETPRESGSKKSSQPQIYKNEDNIGQKSSGRGSVDFRLNKWDHRDAPYSPDFKIAEFQPSDSRKVSINSPHHDKSRSTDYNNGEENKAIGVRESFNPKDASAYHTFGGAKRGSLAKVEVPNNSHRPSQESKEAWAMTYNFDDQVQDLRESSLDSNPKEREVSLAERFMKKKKELAQRIEHQREKSKYEEKEDRGQRTKEEILRQRKEFMKPKHLKSRSEFNIQGDYDIDDSHNRSKSPFANSTMISMFDDRRPKREPNPELLERLTTGSKPNITKKDMLALTNKNFENLPETKKRKEEEKKREEALLRLKKAKEYNQKLRLRNPSKYE